LSLLKCCFDRCDDYLARYLNVKDYVAAATANRRRELTRPRLLVDDDCGGRSWFE
jgi:hypothetical protein